MLAAYQNLENLLVFMLNDRLRSKQAGVGAGLDTIRLNISIIFIFYT